MAVAVPTDRPAGVSVAAAAERRLSAFGLEVRAGFDLPGTSPVGAAAVEADLRLELAPREEIRSMSDEPRRMRLLHQFDGCPYALLEGPEGDLLVCYGHRALLHLSADRRLVRCAPTELADPHWQRVLLDTVLWTVSLLRGFELLHASAVGLPAGVVAFVAASGGGKSTMAAELMRRGAGLFSDDILALREHDGRPLAFPGPPLMNLPAGVSPEELGARPVADIGDEVWAELEPGPAEARPLAAVVFVDRRPGRAAACAPLEGNSLALLPHTLGFEHMPDRAKRRFELFGRVAASTPLLHLSADPSAPPALLADLVEERIA